VKFSEATEAKLERLLAGFPPDHKRAALVPMLLFIQDEVGAVTPEVVEEVCRRLQIASLEVEEVLSYYSMLRRRPAGKYHIQICTNVSCLLCGGAELFEHARRLPRGRLGGIIVARRALAVPRRPARSACGRHHSPVCLAGL